MTKRRSTLKKTEKWLAKRKGVKILSQRPLVFTVNSKTLARARSWEFKEFVKKKKTKR